VPYSEAQSGVDYNIRAFGLIMAAVVMGLWVAVQVGGSAQELAAVVVTFSMASLLVAAVVVGSTVGWSTIKNSLYSVPLFASLVCAATDWGLDILKAVLLSSPAVLVGVLYLVAAALNQLVRRVGGVGKAFDSPEEGRLWITARASAQLAEVRQWRWTGILTNIHWCGRSPHPITRLVSRPTRPTAVPCHFINALKGRIIQYVCAVCLSDPQAQALNSTPYALNRKPSSPPLLHPPSTTLHPTAPHCPAREHTTRGWIIVVMSLVVLAGTFTVVFLSYVRVLLDGAPLAAIYILFYLVGLTMFLNPFIPVGGRGGAVQGRSRVTHAVPQPLRPSDPSNLTCGTPNLNP